MRKIILGLSAGAISVLLLVAQTWGSHIPAPSGFVNDFSGVLSADQKQALETKLKDYQDKTTNEIAVAVVTTMNGDYVEDFAVRTFEEWKIGKRGHDNGVLFLVALGEKQMRIEVGYGLEGSLTDGQAGEIIRDVITPKFKNIDYYGGINDGLDAIIGTIDKTYIPPVPTLSNRAWDFLSGIFNVLGFDAIYLLIFLGLVMTYIVSFMARTKSFWLGGILGGSFGSIVGMAMQDVIFVVGLGLVLGGAGLALDWLLSRNYQRLKSQGKKTTWWDTGGGFFITGGGRGSGGGGFGGFGGGGSGGGGASGSW